MRGGRGFTLVELLVASSILALLAAAGLAAFSTGTRSAAKVRRRGRMLARGQAVLQRMAADLRVALAHKDVRLTSLDVRYEGRDVDTVDFIAIRPARVAEEEGVTGRCEVGYHIDSDPDSGAQWLLRRQDDTLDDDELEGGALRAVGPFVSELNLQFYDGLTWRDGWDDPQQLPAAVRIEMVMVDEDEIEKPMRLSTAVGIMAR